jgi:hypothetical protein
MNYSQFLKTYAAGKLTKAILTKFGCRPFSEPDKDGYVLYLFPENWYPQIPDGSIVDDAFGKREKFNKRKYDNESRFGSLIFGRKIKFN